MDDHSDQSKTTIAKRVSELSQEEINPGNVATYLVWLRRALEPHGLTITHGKERKALKRGERRYTVVDFKPKL